MIAQILRLRDKVTGRVMEFPLYDEKCLDGFKDNEIVTRFDMSKLEIEYDYDTDNEQLTHSKRMLIRELIQAIDFFIKDDPIRLVDNVMLF